MMKLSELLAGVMQPSFDTEITGLTCDSRRVEKGGAFVCIDGTAIDGHIFAENALKDGAAAIITSRPLGLAHEITVPSTRFAWARMCANWFGNPGKKLHMIGITGTNGKTTTSYMVKSILEANGAKVGLVGTIQNMVGDRTLAAGHTTPDPYELQSMLSVMVAENCTHVVMEVSSHALDQFRVEGCAFDIGVFTNLTQDHLDYHGTMENYFEAKKKLFVNTPCAVLNLDDEWAQKLQAELTGAQVYTYSTKDTRADYTARNIRMRADGVDFELVGPQVIARIRLGIPGEFSVYNALAAATSAIAVGVPFDIVTEALSACKGVKGRAEIVPTDRPFTVVIDYAHTPDGIENICKTMKPCCNGRLITVFGCGGDRDRTKRPKMGAIAAKYSDYLVVTSDNPRSENPAAIIDDILEGIPDGTPHTVVENRVEAIHWALSHAKEGDIVLLAGKGHETYQVLKGGVIHLDEREVVAEALAGTAE